MSSQYMISRTAGLSVNPPTVAKLEYQLQEADYEDLSDNKVDQAREFEEKLGADGAHALLAAGSKEERKAVAFFLSHLTPLRLLSVETFSTSDRPSKALLFGEIQPGLPVVAILQPDYLQSPGKRADLFVGGVFCDPDRGLEAVSPHIVEFDFSGLHTLEKNLTKRRRLMRKEIGVQPCPIFHEDAVPLADWKRAVKESILSLAMSIHGKTMRKIEKLVFRTEDETFWYARGERSTEDLPYIGRTGLDEENFQERARLHFLRSIKGAVNADERLRIKGVVQRYSVRFGTVFTIKDALNALCSENCLPPGATLLAESSEDERPDSGERGHGDTDGFYEEGGTADKQQN